MTANDGPGQVDRRTGFIESLFIHQDAISRHLGAPLLREREAYLWTLFKAGCEPRFLREQASTLLNVVRLLKTSQGDGSVDEAAISQATAIWMSEDPLSQGKRRESRFRAIARSWSRFLGVYVAMPAP